jgi:hypothetical protein
MAGMFAQEPPPDVEVPSRRQPRERPEVVAEVGLVVVAGATGERIAALVDRLARRLENALAADSDASDETAANVIT